MTRAGAAYPRKFRPALAAMAVLCLVGGTGAQAIGTSAAGPAVRTLGNQRLGNDTVAAPARDAPGLAVDPADQRHLVAVDIEVLSRTCEYRVSRDGGRTWRKDLLRAPAGFPAQPCDRGDSSGNMDGSVVFGTGQSVYTVFSAKKNGVDTVLLARSSDGGESFAVGVPALTGANYPTVGVQRRRSGDRLYVTGGGKATVARSDDGGRTWTEPMTATPPGVASAETTDPVLGADGTLYLGWRSGTDLVVGRSTDLGRTWTSRVAATVPSGGSNFPALAVSPAGATVYLTWGQNPPAGSPAPIPRVRTQVYAQDHFIPKDADVMVVTSQNGSRGWSLPLRVNDDLVGNGIAQRHPNISVARSGRVDIVWHDRRHAYRAPKDTHQGNGEARFGDTYLAYSTDQARTFSANRRLTDRSINNDLGLDYKCCSYWSYGPRSVPIGDDEILTAWSDTREGGVDTESQQIYLSRVKLNATGPLPVVRISRSAGELPGALSTLGYPAGTEAVLSGSTGFANAATSRVVIVNPADRGLAVAAGVLARARLGTVLPAGVAGLSASDREEVRRFRPVEAVLLGSAASVPESVRAPRVADGVPSGAVQRIDAPTQAGTAALAARSMDRRPGVGGGLGVPTVGSPSAFDAAVVLNPDAPESVSAAALAATFRLPVLLTGRDTLPAETRAALALLDVTTTLVIGGPQAVSDAVAAQLPGPVRLAGSGVASTSEATVREAVRRGAPSNIVYVADSARPFDADLLGPVVARAGGLLLLTPGADPRVAERQLTALGIRGRVDRLVVVGSATAAPVAVGRPRTPPPSAGSQLPATGLHAAPLGAALALLLAGLMGRFGGVRVAGRWRSRT